MTILGLSFLGDSSYPGNANDPEIVIPPLRSPGFPVALIKCVRLSLRKGAFVALFGAAWQEIRVRFGRDDNFRFAFFG
jgi:hypothetical protein